MLTKMFLATLPEPVKYSDTGADILYHLDENRVSDLPVVEGNELIGSVKDSDVYSMSDPDQTLKDMKISLPRDFVFEYQHVFDVVKSMVSSGLTVLPVVNEQEKYCGCVTAQRILPFLANLMSVQEPGAIIVLEINRNDYVLSEIARIVESQDSRILNLYLNPNSDSTSMDVMIKVNTLEIQGLMKTFNRYNYIIKATYTEDEKMYDDLKDRYDSLMKYLSI